MATLAYAAPDGVPLMAYINVRFEEGADYVSFPRRFVLEGTDTSRFLVGVFVGGGGNSSVFEARELASDDSSLRTCAVKMQRILTPQRMARFRNEIRIHEGLEHPRIAAFYGAGEWNPSDRAFTIPWIAMDLGGLNLYKQVQGSGPLDRSIFVKVALQATEAVAYLHSRGIVHRDIKPANFVWAYPHPTDEIRMIDFGIAKRLEEDVVGRQIEPYLTQTMEFVGPQNFSSPELLRYAQDKSTVVDHRSDLFQLGLLFWYLATGRILAGSPDEDYDPFGGDLQRLVADLTRENPTKRPASGEIVAERLKELNS